MSDYLQPAEEMKIERRIYFNSADISPLTPLSLEQLQTMRGESAAAEQAIFDNLQEAAGAWEVQAEKTLLYDKAMEYLKTPPVKHTANKWEKSSNDYHEISNTVYKMTHHFTTDTKYDRATQKSVPVAWHLTWSVYTNPPARNRITNIAGQSRKRFENKADMEKYLAGRIKAYAHLFTEISPPIPQGYVDNFRVNGQLLPGYTVQGEEPKIPDRAADKGGVSISEQQNNEPRKEQENMNEPLNIKLSTREQYEAGSVEGAWLKLPAAAEQLNAALARIGAQGKEFVISGIETAIPAVERVPLENIQKAGLDELNFLAAGLEKLDDKQIEKLNAAALMMTDGDIRRLAELTQNPDSYDFHPDISSSIQLGEHLLDHSGLIQIPDEWAGAIDVNMLGELAASHEKGLFTEYGYIAPNGAEWKPVNEIPQEYKIMPEIDYDVISTRTAATVTAKPPEQTKPAPVIPIVLTSENPRDRMKEITAKLENGIKGIFESEQYKAYLQTLSKFHNYSMNNCILIAMQKPDATHVAGFNDWRDKLKRPVMKGEKGIKILAPAPFKTTKEVDRTGADGKPVFDGNGRRAKDTVEVTVPAFKIVSVFDVSQTDGEPLPALGVNELTGSVDRYKELFAALEKTSPVPVAFEHITTGAKGYHHTVENRIAINEGMSELQNLKTLIHEISHARLHAIDANLPLREQNIPDRRTREVEAESIAFAVCAHYGLDTSEYSFGYVASWSGGKELDVLKSSLDTIRKEADAIISEVDKHFAELTKDKAQTAERPAPEQDTPELQKAKQELGEEVKATLQFFIDSDMKDHGALRPATLEMIAVQGYELRGGKLEEAPPVNGTFTIYQVKDGDETRDIRYEPFGSLKAPPDMANYDNVHTAPLKHGDTPARIFMEYNFETPQDFKGHSLSISDVVVINRDGQETAFYVDKAVDFKELPDFLKPKEPAREAPAPSIDLKIVADYLQKQVDYADAADPNKQTAAATVNIITRRLDAANERIPDNQPMLKALINHAAQSPDLATLKERMNTLQSDFIQHYSTAVQMTIDTSGKAEPKTPAATVRQNEPAPAPKAPAHGENVAAIEAKVKAGEVINLSDLSDAIKKDKAAAQTAPPGKAATGKTAQTRTSTPSRSAAKPAAPEKPSIHDDIAAGKKQLAAQKSAPAKAQNKNAGLED